MARTKQQFEKDWNSRPFKIRNIVSTIEDKEGRLKKFSENYRIGANICSCELLNLLTEGKVVLNQIKHESYPDHFRKTPKIAAELEKLGFNWARQQRSVATIATRFYKGYAKRNSKLKKSVPNRPSVLRGNKAIHLKDGVVKNIQKNSITMNLLYGETVVLPANIPENMLYKLQYLPQTPGGNLIEKNGLYRYVSLVKIPFEWKYQPIRPLGFDFNKTKNEFMVFSEEIGIGKKKSKVLYNKYIDNLQNKLKEFNDLINSKITSRRRRCLRKAVKRLHRRLKKLYIPICTKILDYVEANQLLLCIDDLTCGAKTGSFGQDKVRLLLCEMCENRRIPFVKVPTPYTSKACNICKSKAERIKTAKILCPKCGEIEAHFNAALNIRDFGWEIWEKGQASVRERVVKLYKKNHSSLVE